MRLYLDLDGVLADFDTHYKAQFPHRTLTGDLTNEEWQEIHDHGTFFLDLPQCQGAHRLFQELWSWRPIILTACPPSNYQAVARQKREWVRKNFGSAVTVLPVIGGTNKPMFMHTAGDVLIDDFGKNCRAWVAEGGRAIKHETVDGTLKQFKELKP